VREFGQAVDFALDYVCAWVFEHRRMSATSLMVRMFVVVSTSPSIPYGATEVFRDRRGSSFSEAANAD
jgi:hypothetical protein